MVLQPKCPEGGEHSWVGGCDFVTSIITIRQQEHSTFWGVEPHKCDPNINCLIISNSSRLLRSQAQPQLRSLSPQSLRIPGIAIIIPSLCSEILPYVTYVTLLHSSLAHIGHWTLDKYWTYFSSPNCQYVMLV